MSKDQSGDNLQKPAFAQVIVFENIHGPNKALSHPCFYDLVAFRAPKKGEHFLTGPTLSLASKAGHDYNEHAEYWVVIATNYATQVWHKGSRV